MSTISHDVPEIGCAHGEAAISTEVCALPGVDSVDVDLESKRVAVSVGDLDDPVILAVIYDLDYEAVWASAGRPSASSAIASRWLPRWSSAWSYAAPHRRQSSTCPTARPSRSSRWRSEWPSPVVAWMRARGHGWRLCIEMATSMLLPTAGALALLGAGLVTDADTLHMLDHTAMSPIMLVAMLLRPPDEFARHHHYQRSTEGEGSCLNA